MIDFACKKFKVEEIVKCGLGLTKSDLKVLYYMLDRSTDEFNSIELSKKLKLNLSTIQRSLKRLHDANTIQRKQINFESGGYEYSYSSIGKKETSKIIMKIIKSWVKKVEKEFESW